MRAKALRLKYERKQLGLVVLDYLQLITCDGRTENRQQEIATISRTLKGMAKDLDVPVLALSQLNRSAGGDGARPTMDTLRESGALEQDADVVLLLRRPEASSYNPDDAGLCEAIVAKQRNGPTGILRLSYQKQYHRFSDLAPDSWAA